MYRELRHKAPSDIDEHEYGFITIEEEEKVYIGEDQCVHFTSLNTQVYSRALAQ